MRRLRIAPRPPGFGQATQSCLRTRCRARRTRTRDFCNGGEETWVSLRRMSTQNGLANDIDLPSRQSNESGWGFYVAAVTIETSVIRIRFGCNRHLLPCASGGASNRLISNERLRPAIDIAARSFSETLAPMSTIVIYEADDLMRALLQEWLAGAGYRASAAAPCAPPSHVAADLLIVSIGMPKHTGSR